MSEMAPVSYDYTIVSPCRPDEVSVEGIHLATNARVRSREAPPDLLARLQLQVEALSPEDVPRLVPGETGPPSRVSPHPAETVSLGPGTVRVTGTRVFPLDQQVRIAPGTTLLMGEGASLVFLGPVMAKGTRSAPIRVAKGSAEAWGGIALQGEGTRGSQLEYVEVSGGSVPEWRLASFPGMVNFHDTEQITLRNCTFSDNEGDGDMVHAAYVEDLKIEDSSARGASADALDIEFSSGILRRMDITGAGDDGLDLMGARVEFSDSVIAGAAGNGISSGEESEVTVRNALVASGGVGVLVKNASRAYLYGSMLFGNGTGVEVYQRTVRFEGENRVTADVLFVVESLKKSIDRKDRARDDLDLGRIQTHLPRGDSLASLKNDVLELSQWDDLPRWLAGPGERKGR
jgi:hypothetical protein